MIHHITPGRSDLNFGKAVNDIVKLLPKNDWVCLRDIDSMPAYHEKFFETCENIVKNTNFALIGCMTNRCDMKDQLISGDRDIISHNTDWKHHRAIGKELYKKHGSNVKETDTTIAGMFMLFPVKVWKQVSGFKEGSIRINGSFVDWHFCNDIKNKGYKTGIAQGIYLIHQYRPDHNNPRGHTNHLE